MKKIAVIKKSIAKKAASTYPWTTGDYLIQKDGSYRKVGKVTKKNFELLRAGDSGEWKHYSSYSWDDREISRFIKLEKSIEEYEADLIKELQTGFSSFESGPESDSTEVALSSSKDQATSAKQALENTTRSLNILEGLLARKRNHLRNLQSHFEKQLEEITRVVNIIELYLGVSEEIVQIAEGEPAPADEPISIRQLCLHMDEEAADLFTGTRDGRGRHVDDIDFTNIEKFDSWVRKNYAQLLPELKGVVVCRPRRTEKDYRLGDSPLDKFTESEMNQENFKTYYLLRNGKNIYRISTDKIHVYPVLFPSKEEFQKLSQPNAEGELNDDQKQKLMSYQRNVLMLQGLLDRTDVFKPLPAGINLLKPETYGNSVRFIHDAESLLGNGQPDFWKWIENLNAKTKLGDRVYFTGFEWNTFRYDGRENKESLSQRFPGTSSHRPSEGVYNVIRVEPHIRSYYRLDERPDSFICHFNPKDTVYKRGSRWERSSESERKMSIPFRLFKDDKFMINYEHLKREEAEFYLKDRVNRKHYIKMMPIIRGILAAKDDEKVWEDNFKTYMSGRFKKQNDLDFLTLIEEGIVWWKTKVIEKRPLQKEDAKAVRMIEGFLKRRLKDLE